ncbi:MAG TPA: hypothetical protein VMW16_15465 [Sedimentisphaerales bacterium]|nr:hypothetical protein [Sedimentisphaerales bacterium]
MAIKYKSRLFLVTAGFWIFFSINVFAQSVTFGELRTHGGSSLSRDNLLTRLQNGVRYEANSPIINYELGSDHTVSGYIIINSSKIAVSGTWDINNRAQLCLTIRVLSSGQSGIDCVNVYSFGDRIFVGRSPISDNSLLAERIFLPLSAAPQNALSRTKISAVSTDPELEKAWACNPTINNENSTQGFNELYFRNSACNPQDATFPSMVNFLPAETKRLAELLLNKYHINLSDKTTFKDFEQELNRREQAKNNAKQDQANLREERAKKLRSGAIKFANISDALLVYPEGDGTNLLKISASPLLVPNNTVISGLAVIDALEKPNLIRAKATSPLALYTGQGGAEYRYVYLRLTKTSTDFTPENLRVGGVAIIVGKYVQNVQYRTIAGELKTAPLLDVMFISGK